MTLDEIRASKKEMLVPNDIAPLLGVNPQSIRTQAQHDPYTLGFNVSVIGTRTLIPREPFIEFMTNWKGAQV